jgi:hypothetical protein
MMNENSHELACASVADIAMPSSVRSERRRQWPFLIAIIAPLAGIGLLLIIARFDPLPEPDVRLGTFMQIRVGMSVSDVNTILGVRGQFGPGSEGEWFGIWRRGDAWAEVSFRMDDGKVTSASFVTPDGKQYWINRDGKQYLTTRDGKRYLITTDGKQHLLPREK